MRRIDQLSRVTTDLAISRRGGLGAAVALMAAAPASLAADRPRRPATSLRVCGASPVDWTTRFARFHIDRLGDMSFGRPGASINYPYSLLALSLFELSATTGDNSYRDYGEHIIGSWVAEDGSIKIPQEQIEPRKTWNANQLRRRHLDDAPVSMVLIRMYARTKEEKYRRAVEGLYQQISNFPRTLDGVYSWEPSQIWLDGLWFLMPFLARYAKEFGKPEIFDDLKRQYQLVWVHMRDPVTGLFYHGYDERRQIYWADRHTGLSSSFWSRAVGWYAMSLVDTLYAVPPSHPLAAELIAQVRHLAAALVKQQDPETGLWWIVMDKPRRYGNYLEASASAMFIYFLARGVNAGYLSDQYVPTILKAYGGFLDHKIYVDPKGGLNLLDVVQSAGLGARGGDMGAVSEAVPPGPPAQTNASPYPPSPPSVIRSSRDATPWGRDGSFEYYVNQPNVMNNSHGLGAVIRAGNEVARLSPAALSQSKGEPLVCKARLPARR